MYDTAYDSMIKRMIAKSTPMPKSLAHITLRSENDIENYTAERILICHDYEGNLPDLSLFPNLKSLCISKSISLEAFEKYDLSNIEDLTVIFDEKYPLITINIPNLKKLSIHIPDNERDQLSLFEPIEAVIDISNCSELEEIQLRHFTGYTVKASYMPFAKKIVCCDFRYYDFALLKFTPNLLEFTASGCKLRTTDFLKSVPKLKKLSLDRNELQSVDEVFDMKNLEFLYLYRNPLDNVEDYKSLSCRTLITEEDNELSWFLSSMGHCEYLAYCALKSARNPNVQRKTFIQESIDKQTDEQIFLRNFIRYINDEMDSYFSGKKLFKPKLASKEICVAALLEKYPFLNGQLKI